MQYIKQNRDNLNIKLLQNSLCMKQLLIFFKFWRRQNNWRQNKFFISWGNYAHIFSCSPMHYHSKTTDVPEFTIHLSCHKIYRLMFLWRRRGMQTGTSGLIWCYTVDSKTSVALRENFTSVKTDRAVEVRRKATAPWKIGYRAVCLERFAPGRNRHSLFN